MLARLEGLHAVKHALRFGAVVERVVTDDLARAVAVAAHVAPELVDWLTGQAEVVSPARLRAEVSQPVPTHVVAWAQPPVWGVVDAWPTATRPAILLDDPRNSKNLGAVIRVGAAVNAAGLLINGAVDPLDPMAIRGAAGLQWALPTWASPDLLDALDARRAATAVHVVGLDAGGATFAPSADDVPTVYAFGSERSGLSPAVLARCDVVAALPMRAGVSSLNLATCVAAVCYLDRAARTTG